MRSIVGPRAAQAPAASARIATHGTDARRAEGARTTEPSTVPAGANARTIRPAARAPSTVPSATGSSDSQRSSSSEDDPPLALDDREPRFTVAAPDVERTGDDGGGDRDQRGEDCEQSDHRRQRVDALAWRARQPTRASSTRRSVRSARRGTRVRARRVLLREEPLRGGEGRSELLGARRRDVPHVDRELVDVREETAADGARDPVELLGSTSRKVGSGESSGFRVRKRYDEVDPVGVVAVRVERQVDGADRERDGAVSRSSGAQDELKATARRRACEPAADSATRTPLRPCPCTSRTCARAPSRAIGTTKSGMPP